jgi:N-acetyl-gamma-glutamyl-phosphate reductase
VVVTGEPIDLKSVVNTNKLLIEVNQEGTKLAIHVAIDNLLKGASGQAVQNYNLISGFPETMGLKLKGVAF